MIPNEHNSLSKVYGKYDYEGVKCVVGGSIAYLAEDTVNYDVIVYATVIPTKDNEDCWGQCYKWQFPINKEFIDNLMDKKENMTSMETLERKVAIDNYILRFLKDKTDFPASFKNILYKILKKVETEVSFRKSMECI